MVPCRFCLAPARALRDALILELLPVDTTFGAQHDGGHGSRCLPFDLRGTLVSLFACPQP
jgi:hypothetical protein